MTIQRKRYVAIGLLIGTVLVLVTLLLWINLTKVCGCTFFTETLTVIEATNAHVETLIVATQTAKTASAQAPSR
jgi:hypothetical protein